MVFFQPLSNILINEKVCELLKFRNASIIRSGNKISLVFCMPNNAHAKGFVRKLYEIYDNKVVGIKR